MYCLNTFRLQNRSGVRARRMAIYWYIAMVSLPLAAQETSSDCRMYAPEIKVLPESLVMAQKGKLSVLVSNKDSGTCAAGKLRLSNLMPPELKGQFSESVLELAPGETRQVEWQVSAKKGSREGGYAATVMVNSAGAGSLRPNGTAMTLVYLDVTAPKRPKGLAASADQPGKVALTWLAAKDNRKSLVVYQILRNDEELAVVGELNFVDQSVLAGVVYHYQVRARDEAGNLSKGSNTATVTAR